MTIKDDLLYDSFDENEELQRKIEQLQKKINDLMEIRTIVAQAHQETLEQKEKEIERLDFENYQKDELLYQEQQKFLEWNLKLNTALDKLSGYEQALKDLKRMAHNTPLNLLPNVVFNLVEEVLED